MPETDLLSEATALAEQHFGADPVAEAAKASAEIELEIPEPPAGPQPDPDAGLPYAAIDPDRAASVIGTIAPQMTGEGVTAALTAMRAVPREVLGVLDELGALGTQATWSLLAALGDGMEGAAPMAEPPSIAELEAHAREHRFPNDEVTTPHNVRVFLDSLPPAARGAFMPLLGHWPVWDLADHLGERLWGYTPTWPLRGPPALQPAPSPPSPDEAAYGPALAPWAAHVRQTNRYHSRSH